MPPRYVPSIRKSFTWSVLLDPSAHSYAPPVAVTPAGGGQPKVRQEGDKEPDAEALSLGPSSESCSSYFKFFRFVGQRHGRACFHGRFSSAGAAGRGLRDNIQRIGATVWLSTCMDMIFR